MAVRPVRFRPLILDGVGEPAIARGSYLITSLKQVPYGDVGQLLVEPGLTVAISGAAVTKDLPVVEAGDHNCLVVKGFFGPNAKAPQRPSSIEYVWVPAGGSVIDYEDLQRVLPDTLGPIGSQPVTEWEQRLLDVEAILAAGGGSGGGAPAGGGTGGRIRPEDLEGITSVGILLDKPTDAAAARTAIGAGTSSLALGTSSTTAARGDTSATIDTTETITGIWTFSTNPVFNNDSIPQARVVNLTANLATATAAGSTAAASASAAAASASAAAASAASALAATILMYVNHFKAAGVWPARPTTFPAGQLFNWVGDTVPTLGGTGMAEGDTLSLTVAP